MENCYGRKPSDCKCQIVKDKDFVCSETNMQECTFYKAASEAIDDYLRCRDPEEPGKLTKNDLIEWVKAIQAA